jgi:hypothetical protein
MSEYPTAEPHGSTKSRYDRFFLPYVILASVFCGLGIFGAFYWLYTLSWTWFAFFLVFLTAGALMLFSRGSGPDHA